MKRAHRFSFLLGLVLPVLLSGQQPPAPADPPAPAEQKAPPPSPCAGPEFRQFDFWLGSWMVTTPDGKPAGENEITSVSNGCAIREQWKASNGNTGTSLNYFDRSDGAWHQLWVGGGGLILHLKGGLEGGAMVMSGARKAPQGEVIDRIRWTPQPDGSVQQEWSLSEDGGKTWKVVFPGKYSRR